MGFIKAFGLTFKSMFDKAALADQTIATTEVVFQKMKRTMPGDNQHAWLAETWLNRMKARGEEVTNMAMRKRAFDETFVYACVEPQQCFRGLALSFLNEENPIFVKKYPDYWREYTALVYPVMEAIKTDKAKYLYRKYNVK